MQSDSTITSDNLNEADVQMPLLSAASQKGPKPSPVPVPRQCPYICVAVRPGILCTCPFRIQLLLSLRPYG